MRLAREPESTVFWSPTMLDRTGNAQEGAWIATLRRSLPLTLMVTTACGRLGFDNQLVSSGASDAHTTGPGAGATDATSPHDSGGSGGSGDAAAVTAGNGVGTCAN